MDIRFMLIYLRKRRFGLVLKAYYICVELSQHAMYRLIPLTRNFCVLWCASAA